MLCAAEPRGRRRGDRLGVAGLVEPEREGAQRRAARPAHEPDHGGRVESAGEEGPDGHVGHDMGANRVVELVAQRADELGPAAGDGQVARHGGEIPERARLKAARAEPGALAGQQAADAPVDRPRGGHGEPREVVGDGDGIDLARGEAGRQQGVQLRGEQQPAAVLADVERLDAQRVAGEEEALLRAVPDGEGEHAPQPRQAGLAPAGVGGQQHLRVALRAEHPAARGQLVAQRAEVVDRPVEDEVEAPVVRDHRLVAVGRIENRQPPHADRGVAVRHESVVIRAAVPHGIAHPPDGRRAGLQGITGTDHSGYATHRGKLGRLRPVTSRGKGPAGWPDGHKAMTAQFRAKPLIIRGQR